MVRNWRIGGTTALACVCSLGALAAFAQQRPKIDYQVAEQIPDSGAVKMIALGGGGSGGIAGNPCGATSSPANCQEPDAINGLNSTGTYTSPTAYSGAFRVADDFSPATAGNITSVCWWGVYATGGVECAPLPTDSFRIRIYSDNNGRPSTTLLGEYVQGTNLVVAPRDPAGALGPLTEYQYSGTLSGALVNGATGTCYWIEITNNVSGCTWFWETGTGDGIYAAAVQDGDSSYGLVDVVQADMAFCIGNGLGNPTNAPCSVTGTGTTIVHETCTAAVAAGPFPTGYLNIGTPATFDNRGTVNEGTDPDLCPLETPGPGGVGSVWAKFRATRTRHQISTCSPLGTDTIMGVYNIGTCGSLTQLACNDDACGDTGFLSQVCLEGLTVGNDYLIQIRAFDDAARGVYNLTVGPCLDCQAHQPTGGYLIIPSITGVVGCWDDLRPIETASITNMTCATPGGTV
jgi:hypothetical protein